MPQVWDQELIRSKLELDRPWAAYALADLEPSQFALSTWFSAESSPAICLLYRGFSTPVLVSIGNHVDSLLGEVDAALGDSPQVYVSVRPDVFAGVKQLWSVVDERPMFRMLLETKNRIPVQQSADIRLLDPDDLNALQILYEEESPDFFLPEMLTDGVYFGAFEDDQLIAVAGTHVVAPRVSVAAVGNVYTHRGHRRRGHSTRVTAAVTNRLTELGYTTIVLNVSRKNQTAIRIYERLGYETYCAYYEAIVARRFIGAGR